MSRRRVDKDPDTPPCECLPWQIKALHDVLMRSPDIRFKELVFKLQEEYHINIASKTWESYMAKPGSPGHRCFPWKYIVPLSQASNNSLLVDELERQLGREIPGPLTPRGGNIETACLQMIAGASTLTNESVKAMTHGLSLQALTDLKPFVRDMRRSLDSFESITGYRVAGRSA